MLHLIHPALVHFSVALLLLGAVVEAASVLVRVERLERFGGGMVLVGTSSLVPTVIAGFLAENSLDVPDAARALLDRHERAGLVLLGVFASSQFLKAWWRGRPPAGWRAVYVLLLAVGAVLVAYTAFLGGEMVYGRGLGVIGAGWPPP